MRLTAEGTTAIPIIRRRFFTQKGIMSDEKGRELLDDKIVEYFNCLESLFQCQQELQDLMSEGFLNLSKARYSMGVKAVGALQFDGREMSAIARVDVKEKGRNSTEDMFVLTRNEEVEVINEGGQSQLRHRQTTKSSDEENFDDMDWINEQIKKMGIGELDGLSPDSKPRPKPASPDPLRWFGVLVPQALRSGQTNFQNTLSLVVEMANIRNRLLAVRESYAQLKANMESDASFIMH